MCAEHRLYVGFPAEQADILLKKTTKCPNVVGTINETLISLIWESGENKQCVI